MEQVELERIPWPVRKTMDKKWIAFRYMDDVVHVIAEDMPMVAYRTVMRFTRKIAYGRTLSLLRTKGNEAFGFRWHAKGHKLTVEQEQKYVVKFDDDSRMRLLGTCYEGNQFDTRAGRKGILLGYFLRLVDCTNEEKEHVEDQMIRLVLEALRVGHSRDDILDVMRELEPQVLLSLTKIRSVLTWRLEEQQLFRLCYDVKYRMFAAAAE
jgi:hypothetical protein